MSIDMHDQYCGSFGEYSDCKQCRDKALSPKAKASMRLPSLHVNTSIAIPVPKSSKNASIREAEPKR